LYRHANYNTILATDAPNVTIINATHMDKLKQEYMVQVRNTLFIFLNKQMGMSVSDIGEMFDVDKSTVSRAVLKNDANKSMLMKLTKYFK